jgi:hypothetical protein
LEATLTRNKQRGLTGTTNTRTKTGVDNASRDRAVNRERPKRTTSYNSNRELKKIKSEKNVVAKSMICPFYQKYLLNSITLSLNFILYNINKRKYLFLLVTYHTQDNTPKMQKTVSNNNFRNAATITRRNIEIESNNV